MNHWKFPRSAAAVAVATALAMASGAVYANALTYGETTFGGYNAAIDQTTHLAWVSPNIAGNDTLADLASLCPNGTCTGSLAGLTWASDSQVDQFWEDIGIPLDTQPILGVPATFSYSSIGKNLLGGLINFLGPTQVTGGGKNSLGWQQDYTDYLGGITDNFAPTLPIIGQVPNTSYMFHFYTFAFGLSTSPTFDNESAFTFGAGNGTAQDPPTGGWFFFRPTTAVPEPGSLGMMGLGLGILGLGLAWGKRRIKREGDNGSSHERRFGVA